MRKREGEVREEEMIDTGKRDELSSIVSEKFRINRSKEKNTGFLLLQRSLYLILQNDSQKNIFADPIETSKH